MTHPHATKANLNANDVHTLSSHHLQSFLDLDMQNRHYTTQDILDVLLTAASQTSTIDAVCRDLPSAPSANTIRNTVREALPTSSTELEQKLNDTLRATLPKKFLVNGLVCAVDITAISYYGKNHDAPFVRRGKSAAGTSRYHCYASLYTLKRNKRYTLAVTRMSKHEKVLPVLMRLLETAERVGVKIKRLLLDRGFDNNDVVHYLQEQPFVSIMPLSLRGKRAKALVKTRRSYQATFTRGSRAYGAATFEVVVACKYSRGKYRRKGVHARAFIVIGKLKMLPLQLHEEYRRRFGVESSYRCMNAVRASTSSRCAGYRLLLVGIAFLLLNVWSLVKWSFVHAQQRGPRVVLHALLPLRTLCWWLIEVVRQRLGLRLDIYLPVTS